MALNDQLGRPDTLMNDQGNIVWKASNNAFNQQLAIETIGGMNVGFPGQFYDAQTKLWNNWNRYYDASIGRYTQSDPLELAGGLNTYAYVGGNPIRGIDPSGLYTEVTVWGGVGYGSSAFGHVSININGMSFSWAPGGCNTQNVTAVGYNDRQTSFRSGTGVKLNLTPEQESKLQNCLQNSGGSYSAVSNNCGNSIQSCLASVGVPVGNSVLPSSLLNDLLASPSAAGTVSRPGPKPASFPFPPIMTAP
jgi:RHS repeat-associated protein